MKSIDAKYNVKMGYLASKNNVQEYKVYAIVIWMFNLDFVNNLQQALRDNPWPIELKIWNNMTRLLRQEKYLSGTSGVDQYSLVEIAHKKWPKNKNDPDDDEYELPI